MRPNDDLELGLRPSSHFEFSSLPAHTDISGFPVTSLTSPDEKSRRLRVKLTSKLEPAYPHPFQHAEDGVPVGQMSDTAFISWVELSPEIQNAVVTSITWWRSKRSPFHHQFIVAVVEIGARNPGGTNCRFEIRLERIGKLAAPSHPAKHSITITKAGLLERLHDENDLIFGLLDAETTLPKSIPSSPRKPTMLHHKAAFVDAQDFKWRGPPATLFHLARYVAAIIKDAPRYRLDSSNCYYFSRLLIHLIGLRHYSFPIMVSSDPKDFLPRHPVHDPSRISMLFRCLAAQEVEEGILLYRRTAFLLKTFVITLVVATGVYCGKELRSAGLGFWFFVELGFLIWLGFFISMGLWIGIDTIVNNPSVNMLQRHRSTLVSEIDNDSRLTAPNGARGDYSFPAIQEKALRRRNGPLGSDLTHVEWVDMQGPRRPVLPWPKVEQTYEPVPMASPSSGSR